MHIMPFITICAHLNSSTFPNARYCTFQFTNKFCQILVFIRCYLESQTHNGNTEIIDNRLGILYIAGYSIEYGFNAGSTKNLRSEDSVSIFVTIASIVVLFPLILFLKRLDQGIAYHNNNIDECSDIPLTIAVLMHIDLHKGVSTTNVSYEFGHTPYMTLGALGFGIPQHILCQHWIIIIILSAKRDFSWTF